MDEFQVAPADLAHMEELGRVSSYGEGKERYTQLSLYHRVGYNRPFVAVVEGFEKIRRSVSAPVTASRRFAFKFACVGTLERALKWFDDSELTETLRAQVEGYEPKPLGPQVTPNLRLLGYTGPDRLSDALAWLYRDQEASDNAMSVRLERDFAVKQRSGRNALIAEREDAPPPPWVPPFLAALRYFDRQAWSETITDQSVDTPTTAATSPARSSKGNDDAAQQA